MTARAPRLQATRRARCTGSSPPSDEARIRLRRAGESELRAKIPTHSWSRRQRRDGNPHLLRSRWHPSRLVVATAQRRLSSLSLRAYLTPAFDAVAAGEGCIPGSSSSSLSSGGLDLGFDASLLRFRRACISASTDLEGRLLLYSSQSPLARAVYPAADDEGGAAGGGREMGSGTKQHFFPLTSLQIGWYTLIDDAKIMKRWEFDSVNQASSLITSWFSGSYYECQLLQDYLNNISPKGDVFYDAQNNFLTTEWDSENSQSDDGDYGHVQCKPPCSGPYKRRKITRSDAGSSMSEESYSEVLKLSDEWKIGVPALAVHGRVEISRRA